MYKRSIDRFALATALFMALFTSAVPSYAAGTPTGQFIVQATVNFTCSVGYTSNIYFGEGYGISSPISSAGYTAWGVISLDCPAAEYWISLSKGAGAGATFAQRRMTSNTNSNDTLIYSLYLPGAVAPFAAAAVWGDGSEGSQKWRAQGQATQLSLSFNAFIPGQQAPAAGTYFDTIVVTLSF
ncbi:MAG: spore coat protein U domain-containing protein [Betaproteobacteria bacterium]